MILWLNLSCSFFSTRIYISMPLPSFVTVSFLIVRSYVFGCHCDLLILPKKFLLLVDFFFHLFVSFLWGIVHALLSLFCLIILCLATKHLSILFILSYYQHWEWKVMMWDLAIMHYWLSYLSDTIKISLKVSVRPYVFSKRWKITSLKCLHSLVLKSLLVIQFQEMRT